MIEVSLNKLTLNMAINRCITLGYSGIGYTTIGLTRCISPDKTMIMLGIPISIPEYIYRQRSIENDRVWEVRS